jgi:hypothetical protein
MLVSTFWNCLHSCSPLEDSLISSRATATRTATASSSPSERFRLMILSIRLGMPDFSSSFFRYTLGSATALANFLSALQLAAPFPESRCPRKNRCDSRCSPHLSKSLISLVETLAFYVSTQWDIQILCSSSRKRIDTQDETPCCTVACVLLMDAIACLTQTKTWVSLRRLPFCWISVSHSTLSLPKHRIPRLTEQVSPSGQLDSLLLRFHNLGTTVLPRY